MAVYQVLRVVVVLLAIMALPAAASAQSAVTLPPPPFSLPFLRSPVGLWTVTIGANGNTRPVFEGAERYIFSAVPIFSIERVGSTERFHSPRDGASFALIDQGGFRAGPVGKFKAARTAANYAELNGLGVVKTAIELGAFAQYFPFDWFRARVEVRRGFGGHNGVVADFSADVIVPVLERFTVSAGPRFMLADSKAITPYFGVDAVQAAASGLPMFDAKGGSHTVGAGMQLRYRLDPRWEVHSYVEYDRLLGAAAASPLVTLRGSPNQVTSGLGASYSFDARIP
jgi:outer membrane protein